MKSVNGNRLRDGGIDLALQILDEFLRHVIRRLDGLDNAD